MANLARKLILVSIALLSFLVVGDTIRANEVIQSFDADNFDNIDVDPSMRWSFDSQPGQYFTDWINVSQDDGGSTTSLISLSPTLEVETTDCILQQCLNLSGGSPTYELYNEDGDFGQYYTASGDWTLGLYFKFTDLPSGNPILIGNWNESTSSGSWWLQWSDTTDSLIVGYSTDGTTYNFSSPSVLGPITVDTWYFVSITGEAPGLVSRLYNSTGLVDTVSVTATINDPTNAPLFIQGNYSYLRAAAANLPTNYIGDYSLIIDELLFWDATNITESGLLELSTLINDAPDGDIPGLTDYQFSSAVNFTNETGSNLTNKQVAFAVNLETLGDLGFLDVPTLIDYISKSASFGDIAYLITSDNPAENASYVFVEIPSIADDQTYTVNNLLFLSDSNRNKIQTLYNQFLMDGDDTITFTQTGLNLSSNFGITATITLNDEPTSDAWIVDKLNSGLTQGYGLKVDTNGDIVAVVDSEECTLDISDQGITYPFTSTISMFVTGDTPPIAQIALDGNIEQSCPLTGVASTPTDSLVIGQNLKGKLQRITVKSQTTGTIALDLDFEPGDFNQTQAGTTGNSWTWTGSIDNVTGATGSATGTYSIVADLDMFTVEHTGLIITTPEDIPEVPTPNPNIIGTPPSVVTTPNPSVNLPFTRLVLDSADDIGITNQALWFIFFYAVGVMFAFAVHLFLNTEFLSLLLLCIIVLTGTLSDVYSAWLPATTIPLVLGVYALNQLRRVGTVA